jgi:hypothetical protein
MLTFAATAAAIPERCRHSGMLDHGSSWGLALWHLPLCLTRGKVSEMMRKTSIIILDHHKCTAKVAGLNPQASGK